MNKSNAEASTPKNVMATVIPSEQVLGGLDEKLMAIDIIDEKEWVDWAPDVEADSNNEGVWTRPGSEALIGTLAIAFALPVISVIYFLGLGQIGSLPQFSDEDRILARFMILCSYVATLGVIARWLTWAARGQPGPFHDKATVVEYLRRWLADFLSTALIVPMVLVVLQSVSIQIGTVTLALAEANQGLVIGLAFVLGYFSSTARKLLRGISGLTFLRSRDSVRVEGREKKREGGRHNHT